LSGGVLTDGASCSDETIVWAESSMGYCGLACAARV
jgi:hypothetical protein